MLQSANLTKPLPLANIFRYLRILFASFPGDFIMRQFALFACFILLAVRPAFADPLQDAMAAYSKKDYPTALYLFKPLAEQGNASAQRQIAMMYFKAQGTKKDDQEALRWFLAAANQGAVGDELTLAKYYQMDGDNATSLKMAGALGTAAQDYAEARKWLDKAAAKGSLDAVRLIGDTYLTGRGVDQDYKQAAVWLRNAADAGDKGAQYELGLLYKKGLGVGPTDNVQALMWLSLSAAQNNDKAATEKDFLSKTMVPDDIAQANKLVKEWKAKPYTPGAANNMLKAAAPVPAPAAAAVPAATAAPAAPVTPAPAPAEKAPAPAAPEDPYNPDPNAAPAPGHAP